MRTRNLTVALVVVIAVLGGFYSGWKYSQSQGTASAATPTAAAAAAAPAPAASGATGAQGAQGGFGGRGTLGQVTAVNGSVVTIHNPTTGQDTKVQLAADTTVTKTAAGSAADIQPGVSVTVVGPTAADGTVNATSVTIVPSLPAGGRGRATPTPGT
jgi:hypothetical protein